jgi:hypothetical protein
MPMSIDDKSPQPCGHSQSLFKAALNDGFFCWAYLSNRITAIDGECVADHEACARAAKPETAAALPPTTPSSFYYCPAFAPPPRWSTFTPPLILWSPSRLVDPKGAKGMQITTEQAERVLKASILKAHELGISVCIAILDFGRQLESISSHGWSMAWSDRCGH